MIATKTFTDRAYQTRAVSYVTNKLIRCQFAEGLYAPTGSGKTVIMAKLLQLPFRQIVFSHRSVLLDQIAQTLKAAGIRYGFRAAGRAADPDAPIQLAMIQTESKRLEKTGVFDADLAHIDELHCQCGPTYRNVFIEYQKRGTSLLGYTATPGSVGDVVGGIYKVATVAELIEQGFLCPPRVFGCGQPDPAVLDRLKRDANGDYSAKELDKIVKPQVMIGKLISERARLNPDGRPFILFAHSVKASIWWAQSLTHQGIPVAHIDGDDVWVDGKFYKSDSAKRAAVFKMIEDGTLKGVSNRFVLREGFDCPIIGHAILTAPIGSRKAFVQACGRVLRPYKGREYAIIQDHSGSCINHPRLDSDYPWDWQGEPGVAERAYISEMRNDVTPEPIICPECKGQRNAGDTCPYCGFRYAKHARFVIQLDGKLRLIEGRSFKPRIPKPLPGDARIWEKMYWRTVKNGNRTAEQAYVYYSYQNNWRWLPRNLPGMPRYESDWFLPLCKVPYSRLYTRSEKPIG